MEKRVIFDHVLERLLSSFAPKFSAQLITYDNELEKDPSNSLAILEKMFCDFPRKSPDYQAIINTMLKITDTTSTLAVSRLMEHCEEIVKKSKTTPFSVLRRENYAYQDGNPGHEAIFFYTSVLMIADLVCQIIVNGTKSGKMIGLICDFVCVVFEKRSIDNKMEQKFVNQWAVIIGLISEEDLTNIQRLFLQFMRDGNIEMGFNLIKYIRLGLDEYMDEPIMNSIMTTLRTLNIQKKRQLQLTPSIFESVATIIMTLGPREDVMMRLYDMVYPLRRERNTGANMLLIVLMMNLPKMAKKLESFIANSVLGRIRDPSHLRNALKEFRLYMYGKNVDPVWMFWEWGNNSKATPLSCVQWNGQTRTAQSSKNSYTSLFMKYFFESADWSIDPSQLNMIIVHIAALDFRYFLYHVVPEFVALEDNDPRFAVFLMAVVNINSKDFLEDPCDEIKKKDIALLNAILRKKVLSALPIYNTYRQETGIFTELAPIDDRSEDSNREIEQILEKWGVTGFNSLDNELRLSRMSYKVGTLASELIHVVPYVLTKQDLFDEKIFGIIVRCMSCVDESIASRAVSICKTMICEHYNDQVLIKMLVSMMDQADGPESLYMILKLMMFAYTELSRATVVSTELYLSLETCAFIGLCAKQPYVRTIAYQLMEDVNVKLGDQGFGTHMRNDFTAMEVSVKNKIMTTYRRSTGISGFIAFQQALTSNYFAIWVFFITEMVKIAIKHNYIPLLESIRPRDVTNEMLKNYAEGILIAKISTLYDLNIVQIFSKSPVQQYAAWEEKSAGENRKQAFQILKALMDVEPEKACFVYPHCHFSLYIPILKILGKLRTRYNAWTINTLYRFLVNITCDKAMIDGCHKTLGMALSNAQDFIAEKGLGGARVLEWDTKAESMLIAYKNSILEFCSISETLFAHYAEDGFDEDVWPLNSRHITFRILENWTRTKHPQLEDIRNAAMDAASKMVSVGRVFTESVVLEHDTMLLFQEMELRNGNILVPVLKNHFEQLLETYIESYYKTEGQVADTIFQAISEFILDHANFVSLLSGHMILLAMVAELREQANSKVYLKHLIEMIGASNIQTEYTSVIEQVESSTALEILPASFEYAIEAVFSAGFKIIQTTGRKVSNKMIINALIPWAARVRLLPKQTVLSRAVSKLFAFYTPYEFLEKLTETTVNVGKEHMKSMLALWYELAKSRDNARIIPLFIADWPCPTDLKIMLMCVDHSMTMEKLLPRCTFAYYFHVTRCLKKPFEEELWTTDVIVDVLENHWDKYTDNIVPLIHFSIMYRELKPRLFDLVCRKLGVETPETTIESDKLCPTITQIIYMINIMDSLKIDQWTDESLKWLTGSPSVNFAAISFVVFNCLCSSTSKMMRKRTLSGHSCYTPSDEMVNMIIRTIGYHLKHCDIEKDANIISVLVMQSLMFLKTHDMNNEDLIFQYCCAFLDCRVFTEDAMMAALPIFMQAVSSPNIGRKAWQSAVSFVRPMIPRLETDKTARLRLVELIQSSQSHELLLIAAAVMRTYPQDFSMIKSFKEILGCVNESAMCKSLVHYSTMLNYCSRSVANSIFEISTKIVERVTNENNRGPLARIYTNALRMIATCPQAIEFISVVSARQPGIVNVKMTDVYGWDRSFEDVQRNVEKLMKPNNSITTTITECEDYKSVSNFLFSEQLPKIMPFATDGEMLDGMKNVKTPTTTRRAFTAGRPRRAVANIPLGRGMMREMSTDSVSLETFTSGNEYEALSTPKALIRTGIPVAARKQPELVCAPERFFEEPEVCESKPIRALVRLNRSGFSFGESAQV